MSKRKLLRSMALNEAGLSRLIEVGQRIATPAPPIERVPGVFSSPMPYIE